MFIKHTWLVATTADSTNIRQIHQSFIEDIDTKYSGSVLTVLFSQINHKLHF